MSASRTKDRKQKQMKKNARKLDRRLEKLKRRVKRLEKRTYVKPRPKNSVRKKERTVQTKKEKKSNPESIFRKPVQSKKKSKRSSRSSVDQFFALSDQSTYDLDFWKSVEKSLPDQYSLLDREMVSSLKDPALNRKELPKIKVSSLPKHLRKRALNPAVWTPILERLPSSYTIPDPSLIRTLTEDKK